MTCWLYTLYNIVTFLHNLAVELLAVADGSSSASISSSLKLVLAVFFIAPDLFGFMINPSNLFLGLLYLLILWVGSIRLEVMLCCYTMAWEYVTHGAPHQSRVKQSGNCGVGLTVSILSLQEWRNQWHPQCCICAVTSWRLGVGRPKEEHFTALLRC